MQISDQLRFLWRTDGRDDGVAAREEGVEDVGGDEAGGAFFLRICVNSSRKSMYATS